AGRGPRGAARAEDAAEYQVEPGEETGILDQEHPERTGDHVIRRAPDQVERGRVRVAVEAVPRLTQVIERVLRHHAGERVEGQVGPARREDGPGRGGCDPARDASADPRSHARLLTRADIVAPATRPRRADPQRGMVAPFAMRGILDHEP